MVSFGQQNETYDGPGGIAWGRETKVTIEERIHQIIGSACLNDRACTVDKLVAMAYYMGRESAACEVSDMYNAHLNAQHERANACRYSRMANAVVGPETYLYSGDYAGQITRMFGGDPADM